MKLSTTILSATLLAGALALAGCGGSSDDNNTGTPAAETPDPVEMQTSAITTAHGAAEAAVDAVTDTSDDDTVMAADKAVMDLRDAITAATAVADNVKAGYRAAHTALSNQLAAAKADRTMAMNAAQKAADDKARADMNKASEAIAKAIAAHKPAGGAMLPAALDGSSLKVSRKAGDTVIALRRANGVKEAGTNAQSPGIGWNGDRFSFVDDDGVMQKGAVFSNIKSATGQTWDKFFAGHGSTQVTGQIPSNGKLTFANTSGVLKAENFSSLVLPDAPTGSATTTKVIAADDPRTGTYYGIAGTYLCPSAACTVTRTAAGGIDVAGTLTFTPTGKPADIFVASSIPDADYVHFGYWMASAKQRDGSYKHVIDTFAGASTGYNPLTNASNAEKSATYTGAAGGYYVHRDGAGTDMVVTDGEFGADASLTAKFGGDTIAVADQFSISGTISNFQSDGDADLSGWTLMLGQAPMHDGQTMTQIDVGTGPTPMASVAGDTSDAANPGAQGGTWSGTLHGSKTSAANGGIMIPEAVVGEFNGNFANGHVAGAFGAEN